METNIAGQAILDNYIIKKELATTVSRCQFLFCALCSILKSSPAADSHGCGRLVGQIAAARIKHAVEQRAKRTVRPGIIDRRADHKAVGLGKLLPHGGIHGIGKDAMPQFRTFPAGDTTLHGPRPDVDDLRPDAFRFERPGNLGQGDKSVPLPVGAAVYKQYFHSGNVCVRANIGFFGITYTAACSLPDGTPRPESARHIAPCASGGGGHPPAAFRSRDAPGRRRGRRRIF